MFYVLRSQSVLLIDVTKHLSFFGVREFNMVYLFKLLVYNHKSIVNNYIAKIFGRSEHQIIYLRHFNIHYILYCDTIFREVF